MSVIRPPVRPNRVEPVLLERLRDLIVVAAVAEGADAVMLSAETAADIRRQILGIA